MAVSRIGGTSGKLRGQVGSDIYQIKNNGDGTFTQIVYQKGERTETVFTPRLQAQRMCTGMVESLMKALKPLIGISFESGKNKTMSCNAFSAANIRLVQRDCMEHWHGNNKFVFPYYRLGYGDFSELGGPYMISSGTLNKNLFDANICDTYGNVEWLDMPYEVSWLYGLVFNCRIGVDTVDSFRQAHRMTILDKVCFAGFQEWIDSVTDPDDPKHCYQHDWFIAEFSRSIPSTAIMTPEVIKSLFKISGSNTPTVYISRDSTKFIIGQALDYHETNAQYYYWAGFSISHASGKKKISTSFYDNDYTHGEPYLNYRWPAEVFGSWMGEPQRIPYPSPWAPKPPILPIEYQEVTWIKKLSTTQWLIASAFNPNFMSIETRIGFESNTSGLIIGTSGTREVSNMRVYRGSVVWQFNDENGSVNRLPFDNVAYGALRPLLYVPNDNGFVVTSGYGNIINDSNPLYPSDDLRTLRIFGTSGAVSNVKCARVKITNLRTNELAWDLVPCYRKTDHMAGFYCLVHNKFYFSNAQVSDFEVGSPVL